MAETVQALREQFPDAEVLVADDGSRDATAERAEEAGATVVRLPRRGRAGAERGRASGAAGQPPPLRRGSPRDLRPLVAADSELAIAGFAVREGGGFGLAREAARTLIELLSGYRHAPLSANGGSAARAPEPSSRSRPASGPRRE